MKTFIRVGVISGIVCVSMMGCALEGGTPEGAESALGAGDGGVGSSDAARPVVMDATAVPPLSDRPACYASGSNATPSNLTGPAAHQNKCGTAEIAAFRDACMDGSGSPACVALRRSSATCSACIFGSPPGTNDGFFVPAPTHPVGAMLLGRHVNTMGCAALATEFHGCGWPLSMQQSCIETKCSQCDAGDRDACRAHAKVDACAPFNLATCDATVVRLRKNVWEPTCIGATPQESFTKVATFMCGAP